MPQLVETERELDQTITDYQTEGWDVEKREAGRVVFERGLRGRWAWHLLYLILLPIIGNLCYSAYRRYGRPEREVVRHRASG